MPLQTAEFSELPGVHCAIVDIGSIGALLNAEVLGFLQGSAPSFQGWRAIWNKSESKHGPQVAAGIVLRMLREDQEVGAVLNILDRFITHEYIVFDRVALEGEFTRGFLNPSFYDQLRKDANFLLPVKVPEEIYALTATTIIQNHKALAAIRDGLEYDDFDGGDKVVHDLLFELPGYRRFSFADSGDVAERALFYAMIAEKAQAPMLVTPNKASLLRKCSSILYKHYQPVQGIHDQIRDIALESVSAPAKTLSVPLPPVVEQVFLRAIREGQPLINKVNEIRDSKEAVAYRKFIFDLERLSHGTVGQRAEVVRTMAEIQNHIKAWAIDPNWGIKYEMRSINLENLPLVGWVFGAGGKNQFNIKDPRLTPAPAYLRFISGWFHKPAS